MKNSLLWGMCRELTIWTTRRVEEKSGFYRSFPVFHSQVWMVHIVGEIVEEVREVIRH